MSAHDRQQIRGWPAASGWRRVLAVYVDFVLFAVVWKVAIWGFGRFDPRIADAPFWMQLATFLVVGVFFMNGVRFSPGHWALGIYSDGSLSVVHPGIFRTGRWWTLLLGVGLVLEGTKSALRWTLWHPPVPFMGVQLEFAPSAVLSVATGVLLCAAGLLVLRCNPKGVLLGMAMYAVALVSGALSYELWSSWAAADVAVRREFQGRQVRQDEIELMRRWVPAIAVGGPVLVLAWLGAAGRRFRWGMVSWEDAADEGPGLEAHFAYLDSLRRPAIGFTAGDASARSRIGGLPLLPEEIPWPQWEGKPQAFLCQIDLAEIPSGCERHGLPASGMLFVFFDQEQGTWGFEPEDRGSWTVLLAEASSTPRSAPPGLAKEAVFAERPIAFKPIQTYPPYEDSRIEALELSDRQSDEYTALCSAEFEGAPQHQLFGYPAPIQSEEMDLECQLASHGLSSADPSVTPDPRYQELEAGRSDWMLLLQLDSDDDAGLMWGDCGMLYFWITKQDLAAGRFENTWMVLQCS